MSPTTPHPPRYAVQLLLPEPVVLDSAVVHAQMLGWRNDVQLIPTAGSHFGFAIPTQDLPLLAHVFQAAPDAYATQLDDALQWSPTWRERYQAVARCQASLVISMIAHRAVNHATMLLAFRMTPAMGSIARSDASDVCGARRCSVPPMPFATERSTVDPLARVIDPLVVSSETAPPCPPLSSC